MGPKILRLAAAEGRQGQRNEETVRLRTQATKTREALSDGERLRG